MTEWRMLRPALLCLTIGQSIVFTQADNQKCNKIANLAKYIENLVVNETYYDKQQIPKEDGIRVTLEMTVQEISSLSELTSDFELDLMYSEIWRDPALSFASLNLCKTNLTLKSSFRSRIWTPDTCIVNSKQARIHESPSTNGFVILYQNGTVWANVRMQVKAPCQLDLKMFPFDQQRCRLAIESYSYNSQEVLLTWFSQAVTTPAYVSLPDFELQGVETRRYIQDYPNGKWDQLVVYFTFSRRYGFYLFQAYFPTTLTVISSWIGFCLEVKAASARITLGVSSLLALAFQFGTVLRHLPRVSYIKCIDVWMISCVAFIFFTLVQLAFVTILYRREQQLELGRNVIAKWMSAVAERKRRKQQQTNANGAEPARPRALWKTAINSAVRQRVETPVASACRSPAEASVESKSCVCQRRSVDSSGRRFSSPGITFVPHDNTFLLNRRGPRTLHIQRSLHWVKKCIGNFRITSKGFDRFSMFLFPFSFAIFNITYWTYYFGLAV